MEGAQTVDVSWLHHSQKGKSIAFPGMVPLGYAPATLLPPDTPDHI